MSNENKPVFNPMIEALKKFIGREVVIKCFTNAGIMEFKGVCEVVDFTSKTAIIRNDVETIMIPHYMSMHRARPNPQPKIDDEPAKKKK